jgi:hypothetical protein
MPDLAAQLLELKERYGAEDFVVEELEDDDPILRSLDGRIIDTWRESYPTRSGCRPTSTRARSGCCRSSCSRCRTGSRTRASGW